MDEDYQPRNREKARQAKRSTFWCFCDLSLISQVGKCPVCKRRYNRKKIRYE